ncbi:hypothetical protein BJ944DRAFT_235247 [Cunninghamella echinulata]|nr:hypothetical protein BJ944DRAFT_235247 [Cunninghamella echinulata]
MNHDATNGDDYDYEEFITHYHQTTSQSISNYRQQIDQLKRQLAACEIGTQWMMGKYLGELERERLHTKSLKTIVQSQETLIHTMENNYKHNSTSSTLPSSFSTSSMASIASNHHHSQQQYFLLRSQVDLQKMELDDQQDIIHMLMEERELLIKKLNHKSIHLHQQKRRSRAISSSSSTSTSSTSSSSSSSPVRPYSPPHTPPPFDRLPALPTSSSFSSTISSTSTATEPITPPSSQRPSMITFDHKPIIHEYNSNDDENEYENEIGHNKKINDFPPPQRQSSLLHKSSMPDIRSIHYSSLNSPRTSLGQHPSSMDPYLLLSSKKSLSRQRSFWKGWKQRLSN